MPKIDITKTELAWPGKYNEDGTPKVSGHYEPWLRDRAQCGGGSW